MEKITTYKVADKKENGIKNPPYRLVPIQNILYDQGMVKKVKEVCNDTAKLLNIKIVKKNPLLLFKWDKVIATIQEDIPLDPIQVKQFNSLINKLIKINYDVRKIYKNYYWSSKLYLRKDLDKLYKISKNIKKLELKKRIRATNTNKFKPYLLLHGYKFVLDF